MSTTGAGEAGSSGTGDGVERPGWSEADEELRRRIIRDEIRLARDEERIDEEERGIRRSWWLALSLAGLLALTVAALVLSVISLNRDIDEVAAAAPRDDSIGTEALQNGAVTADKLAPTAVTPAALADGAIRSRVVADDAMTGADIDEATLGRVRSAARAGSADTAADAASLGGVAAARYLSRVTLATSRSATSTLAVKGPLSATCPSGTRVVSGGASIDGAARVAITTSTPDGEDEWTAAAAAIGTPSGPWRLEIVAVCARAGEAFGLRPHVSIVSGDLAPTPRGSAASGGSVPGRGG